MLDELDELGGLVALVARAGPERGSLGRGSAWYSELLTLLTVGD